MGRKMLPMKMITGQTFGKYVAVSFAEKRGYTPYWNCLCSCGNLRQVSVYDLTGGRILSCGCSHQDIKTDLTSKRFGRLIVKSFSKRINGKLYWNCLCDCGNEKVVFQSCLLTGGTSSCGCLKGRRGTTHGGSYSYTYKAWRNMRKRCLQPNFKYYYNYGGRGITITEKWLGKDGYTTFLSDMGERPDGLTLERMNNDGNYEPSNCKWATMKEQQNNRRNNVRR